MTTKPSNVSEREKLCVQYCQGLSSEQMQSDMYQGVNASDLIGALYEREKEDSAATAQQAETIAEMKLALNMMRDAFDVDGPITSFQNTALAYADRALRNAKTK